ncbi:MAG: hypothetical protein J6I96_02110 [Oscillospiraceae bacterium]|nr:hypothetical protein [Oscillospiraceae bacterium]
MKHKLTVMGIAALMLLCVPNTIYAAKDPVTRAEFKEAGKQDGVNGMKAVDGKMYYFTDGIPELYTGLVKDEKGSRYYVNGSPWFGWMKAGGKWYYFSPEKGGLMATGTVETGAATYRLAADGSWDGGISKIGKAPADFSVSYKKMSEERYFEFDSTKKAIVNAPSDSEADKYTLSVNVTAKDVQILYDMLMTCRVSELSSAIGTSTGETFAVNATFGGKKLSIVANEGVYSLYKDNSDIRSLAYYTAFMEQYIEAMPQFAQSEQDRRNYSNGANFIDPKITRTQSISGTKLRRYKNQYRIDPVSQKTDVVISSVTEANMFVNDYIYGKGIGKSSIASKLLSYDESFFKNNVLVYNESILPDNTAMTLGKVTYDVSSSTYRIGISAKIGSGELTDCVFLTEIPRSEGNSAKPYAVTEITTEK